MKDEITFRKANHKFGSQGTLVLQEVYSFGEKTHASLQERLKFPDPDPITIICEHLVECDEAFVAEHDGQIVGTSTLAFDGIGGNRMPMLQGVYVLEEYRGRGIGIRLTVLAMERFLELGKTPVYCSIASIAMRRTLNKLKKERPELHAKMKLESEV